MYAHKADIDRQRDREAVASKRAIAPFEKNNGRYRTNRYFNAQKRPVPYIEQARHQTDYFRLRRRF